MIGTEFSEWRNSMRELERETVIYSAIILAVVVAVCFFPWASMIYI